MGELLPARPFVWADVVVVCDIAIIDAVDAHIVGMIS